MTNLSARSLLFVPADAPNKIEKAMACGADAVILDLEDSVSPERKAAARAAAAEFLREAAGRGGRPHLLVRINGLRTGLSDDDLDAVIPACPDAVLLPKAEGGVDVIHADAKLAVREARAGLGDGQIAIVALATETARSLFLAGTFAGASKRLIGLTWGAEDLSVDLGAEVNRDAAGLFLDPYRLARTLCLAGAAAAQVAAIDTVYVDFRDPAGLRRECEAARRDGFAGKLAIHPAQVAIINEVFTPTPEAIARAEAVIAAFSRSPDAGVVAIEGVMYDRPHLLRAQQTLARAKRTGADLNRSG